MNLSWRRTGDESLHRSTYEERIEAIGASLSEYYEQKSESILSEYGIGSDGLVQENSTIPSQAREPELLPDKDEKEIRLQIRNYNRGRKSETKIKYSKQLASIENSAENCCYVSVDDVLVKRQKSTRVRKRKEEQRFVSNTVIHIQYKNHTYALTANSQDKAFVRLLAFLLSNHLLENTRLIFFSDGATSIRDAIQKYFSFREYTLILDWFHLANKCNQYLSMGIKGTMEERKQIKAELVSILFAGNVDFMANLNKKNIKNQKQLDDLAAYLDRKSPYIVCYALRKRFGLRNSSNPVEKTNDRVVSFRQKNHGMSWSKIGSCALALISATNINDDLRDWIYNKRLGFKMAS